MAQDNTSSPCKPLVINETFLRSSFGFRSIPCIQELAKPLKKLGIPCFVYTAYYPDGGHINLSNDDKGMRYYYEHELYENIGYAKPDLPDLILLGNWLNTEKRFIDFRKEFQLSASFAVIQNHPNFRECFHFKIPLSQESRLPELFHRLDLLYNFIAYFKDKGHQIIQDAHLNRILLPPYYNNQPKSDETATYDTTKNIVSFLQATNIKRFYLGPEFHHHYLTRREIDIISLLVRGKNMADIGRQLQLSYKTIDTHLTHIKEKLDCKTLFDIGFKLGNIGKKRLFQGIIPQK